MLKKIAIFLLALICISQTFPAQAAGNTLTIRLSGRLLLAVQANGEAWYINPQNLQRYDLGQPTAALAVLRSLGTGISNNDLAKIPVVVFPQSGADSDSDGLVDVLENAIGTNPLKSDTDGDGYADKMELANNYNPRGAGKLPIDLKFASRLRGRIFLQVQSHGELWYVNPVDSKRYLINDSSSIKALLAKFGLGISTANLAKISAAQSSAPLTVTAPVKQTVSPIGIPYDLGYLEQKINTLVNSQRTANGLSALSWNADIAAVAREHSQDLATENEALTSLDKVCDYFMIHHEGFVFGLYQDNRLNNRGIYYFSASGENIAMQGGKNFTYLSSSAELAQAQADQCTADLESANDSLKASLESNISTQDKLDLIQSQLAKRKAIMAAESTVDIISSSYLSNDEMAQEIVTGWMNSPGHRANILRPQYDESGIGVAYVNGYIIATQDFITRTSCGYQGAACCASNSCFLPNTCQQNVCR